MTNTLGDLGERRLLREVIPNYVAGAGDDCAFVGCANGTLVITTDPVPQPAAQVIGGDPDLYWLGWLLVTINASDIAASGARPVAFVAALDLPRHLEVNKLKRLLKGIQDSCDANGLDYVGGNLREADKIGAVGTAIGSAESNPLRRKGASAGDLVVVIGRGGRFWADVARLKAGSFIERSTSPIFAPVSQAKYICVVNALGLLRCAMDTSDGLAPTLSELALVNDLGIEIDLAAVRSAANYSDVTERPERLWMGWGDWTVVAAVSPMHLLDSRTKCNTPRPV